MVPKSNCYVLPLPRVVPVSLPLRYAYTYWYRAKESTGTVGILTVVPVRWKFLYQYQVRITTNYRYRYHDQYKYQLQRKPVKTRSARYDYYAIITAGGDFDMTAPKRLKRAPKPENDTTETPTMYRGGGAVNDMMGTPVIIKGGSHLTFTVGQSINPTIEDVRYIFKKLYNSKYMKDVVPVWAVEELLVKASVEQINTLVPAVLLAINDLIEYKEYENQDLYFLCVSAYVLAWFDHLNLGGPRPIIESEREKRMVKAHHKLDRMEVVLRCEYCNKVFTPPAHLVRYEKIAAAYLKWLSAHYWTYHKWATFKPAKRVSTKTTEEAPK